MHVESGVRLCAGFHVHLLRCPAAGTGGAAPRWNTGRVDELRIPSGPGGGWWHTGDMDDLRIPPGPGCPRGLVVPAGELGERFSHASGPGGQGVNTADSRVQLSLDLATTTALDQEQRERALARLGERLSGTVLTVVAAEHRSQRRNRAAARERLAALLRGSLAPPRPRRPTKPTRGSKLRRLADKRKRSEVKARRRRPNAE